MDYIDYYVYVPSFQRYDVLYETTLDMLDRCDVDPTRIIIFLKDEEEYDKYIERGNLYLYEVVLTNCSNIKDTRNFLRLYQRKNNHTYVVQVDDDIENIVHMGEPVEELDSLIQKFFMITLDKNLYYWGITPYQNPYFFKENHISTNLNYICGAFNGHILDPNLPEIKTEVGHFEDFYFSIGHFLRDGGLVRFGAYGLETKLFGDGGICGSLGGKAKRKEEMIKNAEIMAETFGPDILTVTSNKWGVGLKLNSRYKSNGI